MECTTGHDWAAEFGDEGWKMCDDEAQLISARKKSQKNERIAWVFEGFDQNLTDALFQLGSTGHTLGLHHRQEDQ